MSIELLNSKSKHYGGKAIGLSRLLSYGFNIPMTIAIDNLSAKLLVDNDSAELEKLYLLLKEIPGNYLAVRSSANIEDGKENSFAGVFDSVLNVNNDINEVVSAIKYVLDSAHGKKAAAYANQTNEIIMNVIIQKMISPKYSGVCFTRVLTEEGAPALYLEYVDGLGDKLVSGYSNAKSIIMEINENDQGNKVLLKNTCLAEFGSYLSAFETLLKVDFAADIEWCIDNDGALICLQLRPITNPLIAENENCSVNIVVPGNVSGKAFIIKDDNDDSLNFALENFEDGDILITPYTDTEYLPILKKASAIITEEGGILSHACIIAREMKKPCIIGFKNATQIFSNNCTVSLNLYDKIIKINNDKIIKVGKAQEIDYSNLYIFDNILNTNISKTNVLMEFIPSCIVVYCEEDTLISCMENIRLILTKIYKQKVYVCKTNKYDWYFEVERYKQIIYFIKLKYYIDLFIEALDGFAIAKIYDEVTDLCYKLSLYRDSIRDIYEIFFINEVIISFYFLLDLYIPMGKGIYFSFCRFLELRGENENISFGDILSGSTADFGVIKEFVDTITLKHDTLWNIWKEKGIRDYNFFENRKNQVAKICRELEIENDINLIYKKFIIEEKLSSEMKRNIDSMLDYIKNIESLKNFHGYEDRQC